MFHLSVMCTSIPSETYSKGIIIILTKIELSIYFYLTREPWCKTKGLGMSDELKGCCI